MAEKEWGRFIPTHDVPPVGDGEKITYLGRGIPDGDSLPPVRRLSVEGPIRGLRNDYELDPRELDEAKGKSKNKRNRSKGM